MRRSFLKKMPVRISAALAFVLLSGMYCHCSAAPGISLELFAGGIESPTHITNAGDGTGRIFVTEQRGRVRIISNGTVQPAPFLDIRRRVSCCGERGLLSVAFPPGYRAKRYFYVNYTDTNGDTVVSRFRLTKGADAADPKSEEVVLKIGQPYSNHNGGQLAFGPDGYLYIGMGDGGSAGDPQGNGQKPGTLLGKMLRIDVEAGKTPYAVPATNPFLNSKLFRPEIWATGLRNPWRYAFDRRTGDLYIADVGQNEYEEINFQPASSRGGENYGWNVMEGSHCFRAAACSRSGLALPVAEYSHNDGCSVTGGMVYRGSRVPGLDGWYLYGDFCSGKIWGLRKTPTGWENALLGQPGISISTFGEDEEGNVYVADYGKGNIYRVTGK